MTVFEQILENRGLCGARLEDFLHPNYDTGHDPFLLPDMQKAVERLAVARQAQERVTVYGDYDIDGLSASAVLKNAFDSFGFERSEVFIPNRFSEGYGMTCDAMDKIAATGATLIVTVDCGSLSEKEIVYAKTLGVDVIVTDHHNVAPVQPPAVAVINPKRLLQDFPEKYEKLRLRSEADCVSSDSESSQTLYPFLDLPGVGVAFKLVQALQTRLDGLPKGQEKWLLDLVALGTVCDIVTLQDENRMHVYWGLEVMKKTRRPGLKALMAVAGIEAERLNARHLGFGLGPRMNAAGRLETAQYALDMLLASTAGVALRSAEKLDTMNQARRAEQDEIYREAVQQAEQYVSDNVLVVSGKGWNHGIIGIVAAKLLEKFKKPTYVLEELELEAKGSARSFGDFSVADAIRASDDIITKGGGHKVAAGVTLPVANIAAFRQRVNDYYTKQGFSLEREREKLLPRADAEARLCDVDEALIKQIDSLEPFGNGNERPILLTRGATVANMRRMGTDGQHVKLSLMQDDTTVDFLAFNAEDAWFVEPSAMVDVWYQPEINEFRGRRSVQGRIIQLNMV